MTGGTKRSQRRLLLVLFLLLVVRGTLAASGTIQPPQLTSKDDNRDVGAGKNVGDSHTATNTSDNETVNEDDNRTPSHHDNIKHQTRAGSSGDEQIDTHGVTGGHTENNGDKSATKENPTASARPRTVDPAQEDHDNNVPQRPAQPPVTRPGKNTIPQLAKPADAGTLTDDQIPQEAKTKPGRDLQPSPGQDSATSDKDTNETIDPDRETPADGPHQTTGYDKPVKPQRSGAQTLHDKSHKGASTVIQKIQSETDAPPPSQTKEGEQDPGKMNPTQTQQEEKDVQRARKDVEDDKNVKGGEREKEADGRELGGAVAGNLGRVHSFAAQHVLDNRTFTHLNISLTNEGHAVNVDWSFASNDSRITGFVVCYRISEREQYDSSKLGLQVRSFTLHSLHKDEDYEICVHAMINTTVIQESCAEWSEDSLKMVTGIMAGVLFLVPCLIALFWILYKDRRVSKMYNKLSHKDKDAQTFVPKGHAHQHVDLEEGVYKEKQHHHSHHHDHHHHHPHQHANTDAKTAQPKTLSTTASKMNGGLGHQNTTIKPEAQSLTTKVNGQDVQPFAKVINGHKHGSEPTSPGNDTHSSPKAPSKSSPRQIKLKTPKTSGPSPSSSPSTLQEGIALKASPDGIPLASSTDTDVACYQRIDPATNAPSPCELARPGASQAGVSIVTNTSGAYGNGGQV
ncbi:uncharacterized protein LOC101857953 [Aplysia californica]|uniref:Uncharacterized protein LOC101857953 n=1 Tax=Aplysia californica TaxID=6500 RepID=A0ABM0JTE5_APLCA|nr:uncharacterized protein LOC101857953 [Aplysia californica]XP_005101048.1 uncharacterized protein LOC101857953 [Aplysia californica]